MQVSGLVAVAVGGLLLQQLSQPPHAGHPQDVDVVVAAESLQQREVDLQRDVIFILLIGGQDAQNHAVRVPAGRTQSRLTVSIIIIIIITVILLVQVIQKRSGGNMYLHIHEFGGLVDSHSDAVLPLRCDQQLLQSLTHRVHPAHTHTHSRLET